MSIDTWPDVLTITYTSIISLWVGFQRLFSLDFLSFIPSGIPYRRKRILFKPVENVENQILTQRRLWKTNQSNIFSRLTSTVNKLVSTCHTFCVWKNCSI